MNVRIEFDVWAVFFQYIEPFSYMGECKGLQWGGAKAAPSNFLVGTGKE